MRVAGEKRLKKLNNAQLEVAVMTIALTDEFVDDCWVARKSITILHSCS